MIMSVGVAIESVQTLMITARCGAVVRPSRDG